MQTKIITTIISWGNALLLAFTISLLISIFIVQPYTVSGSSMEPTLEGSDPLNEAKTADRVMVFKSSSKFGSEPKIGDVVIVDSQVEKTRTLKDDLLDNPLVGIFTNSNEEKKNWIKRVIAISGDKVEFKNGNVYRNGEKLEESYIKEEMDVPFESLVIPENHVFVLGDNRNNSSDSRDIGPVPVENVVGKVILRFYPFDKLEIF
ncbi:signal peptidase I [Alteribacter populi]|uniref:signal peptidase I n=1 Tax=Alteribacter populi TaxID=2011011 RepID=UPI001E5C0800|nr:signal peptidase I [Alteribacter populi]